MITLSLQIPNQEPTGVVMPGHNSGLKDTNGRNNFLPLQPPLLHEIGKISLEDLLTPEASLEESSSSITTKTENSSSTDIQTYMRTYNPVDSPAKIAMDNSIIEVSLGYDAQVENPGTGTDEQDQDMAVAKDVSMIIQDVRTAGDNTPDQENKITPENIVVNEEEGEESTQGEKKEQEDQ